MSALSSNDPALKPLGALSLMLSLVICFINIVLVNTLFKRKSPVFYLLVLLALSTFIHSCFYFAFVFWNVLSSLPSVLISSINVDFVIVAFVYVICSRAELIMLDKTKFFKWKVFLLVITALSCISTNIGFLQLYYFKADDIWKYFDVFGTVVFTIIELSISSLTIYLCFNQSGFYDMKKEAALIFKVNVFVCILDVLLLVLGVIGTSYGFYANLLRGPIYGLKLYAEMMIWNSFATMKNEKSSSFLRALNNGGGIGVSRNNEGAVPENW